MIVSWNWKSLIFLFYWLLRSTDRLEFMTRFDVVYKKNSSGGGIPLNCDPVGDTCKLPWTSVFIMIAGTFKDKLKQLYTLTIVVVWHRVLPVFFSFLIQESSVYMIVHVGYVHLPPFEFAHNFLFFILFTIYSCTSLYFFN